MRPTSEKERLKSEDENGTSLTIDPGIKDRLLSGDEAEIWFEFAGQALQALASNPDLTSNNPPTFVTDEACLMADRMLINYRFRTGGEERNKRRADGRQNRK